jgi:hypothetical protein
VVTPGGKRSANVEKRANHRGDGVISTPATAIHGEEVHQGRIPQPAQIEQYLCG